VEKAGGRRGNCAKEGKNGQPSSVASLMGSSQSLVGSAGLENWCRGVQSEKARKRDETEKDGGGEGGIVARDADKQQA